MSPLDLLLALLLLGVLVFLSLSEISLVGISKIRLRHMVERGVKRAKTVERLIAHLDQVITTILVFSSFVSAGLISLVTAWCILYFGERWGVLVATVGAGTGILLFADIAPKIYAVRSADRVSLFVAPVMAFLLGVFAPVSRFVTQLTHRVFRWIGITLPSRAPLITEEELKLMIELGKEEGVLGEHERMMLHRIFEFGDLKVRDVMIPRDQMVTVSAGATHEEVLTILTEKGHSRIPVYDDSSRRILGVIYAQEMLHIWREGWLIVLQDLIHPPFEVSPEMRVAELLQEFQKRRLQIAIAVDKNAEALGMVTLEDLVEEIVGEIRELHG